MKTFNRLIITAVLCFRAYSAFCQSGTLAISDTTTVIKVELQSTGSENGGMLDLSITKDSTTYFYSGIVDPKGRVYKKRALKENTDQNFWNNLLDSINLSDFDHAPSDRPESQIDGVDVSIVIKTRFREHRVILNHGRSKAGYKKIEPFTDLLLAELHHFDKKWWIFID